MLWFAGGLKKITDQLGAQLFSLEGAFPSWTWRFKVKLHATLVSLMEKVAATW